MNLQEIGVNEFYEEIFKSWRLKVRKSSSSSSLTSGISGSEVIELEDSGDESGDLSIIMEVNVKKEMVPDGDGILLLVTDDPYSETGIMSADLKDYTESTMEALQQAMNDEAEKEAAEDDPHNIYLVPEYSEETQEVANKVDTGVSGHDEQLQSPQPAAALAVSIPSAASSKGFKPIVADQCTVKDVEERIRYLQCFGVT